MSTVQCNACQHVVKGNVRNCPMCGGGMSSMQQSSTKQCPRCTVELELHNYRGMEVDKCIQCEGIWLEPSGFSVLTSEFDVYRDDSSNPNYLKPAMPQSENYLPCACCQKMMSRRNFKTISGVLIDSCLQHGIWLDKGELQHIRNFVASGGLDKAQDRELTKQELQLDALNDRVSDLELMEKMLNKYNLKRIFFRGF